MSAVDVGNEVCGLEDERRGISERISGESVVAERLPQPGGVQEVGGLLNTAGHFSSGNSEIAAEREGDLLNTLGENERAAGAAGALVPVSHSVPATHGVDCLGRALPAPAPFGILGRPTVLAPQVIEQLCMLLSIGFSRRQAAAYLGFSPGSISNAVARDPRLGEEFRRAEEISDVRPELALLAETRKNWRAAAWYMEYRAKHPRPLTEEEKEEQHQARLQDDRRSAEAMNSYMNHATGRAPASVGVERPARKPRGKKSVKG